MLKKSNKTLSFVNPNFNDLIFKFLNLLLPLQSKISLNKDN
jgi:hypothetical protein